MQWIQAMWQPSQKRPARILVAGCGTGNEVFALHRAFPNSEIVGIDFSRRSLAVARQLHQRFFPSACIEFIRADLVQRDLVNKIGGNYDYISCHGVLSYLSEPEKAIAALERCLVHGGALYLGVNGSRHFSQEWRPALKDFGFEPRNFKEEPHLRRTLRLFDALADQQAGVISALGPDFLAGDLFGPLINNWSLDRWRRICAKSGLFLRGSYSAHRGLRAAINEDLFDQLMPRNRADAHAIVERLAPSSFHYLIFTRQAERALPWNWVSALGKYALTRTSLYRVRWPSPQSRRKRLVDLVLTSSSMNTRVDVVLPRNAAKAFRASDSVTSLRNLLGSQISLDRETRKSIYLLYLLGAINLHLVSG